MGMSASDVPKNHPMPAANGIKGGAKVSLHPNHEQYMRNGRTAASQQTASSTRGAPKPYQQPYLQNPHTGRTEQHSNVISKPPHDAVVSAPPPLFERLHTEEAAEIKTYVRLIESQNRRLLDLERIHSDLERRLELETQRRMALEQRLADQERESELRCRALEKEKIAHQKAVDSEKKKNERLREDMCRKDKEIRKLFYQRKYDSDAQTQIPAPSSTPNRPQSTGSSNPQPSGGRHAASNTNSPHNQRPIYRSPHELLAARGSGDAVREHNVTTTLNDFFGLY